MINEISFKNLITTMILIKPTITISLDITKYFPDEG
jgi:hypothetical protein